MTFLLLSKCHQIIKVQRAQSVINSLVLPNTRPKHLLLSVWTHTLVFQNGLIYKELFEELQITNRVWMPSAILWVNSAQSTLGSINKLGKGTKEQEPKCSFTSICRSCKITAGTAHAISIFTWNTESWKIGKVPTKNSQGCLQVLNQLQWEI